MKSRVDGPAVCLENEILRPMMKQSVGGAVFLAMIVLIPTSVSTAMAAEESAEAPKKPPVDRGKSVSLELRRTAIPNTDPSLGLTNPIDRFLAAHFEKHGVDSASVISGPVFARRVTLDLVGSLPTPAEMATFRNDSRPNKRQLLVRRLLNNRHAYATHWLTYWNDLLRNAYRGTGFIDDGRKQITGWLYKSLYDNKPYNQFVHELVHPVEGSQGFVKGIVWRGVVNASQRREEIGRAPCRERV